MYVENIGRQLAAVAEAGGDDARALAERLVGPLDATIRLTLQDVLAAAAEEITCELAPGSVELRLRGRDPEFVVTPPPVESPAVEAAGGEAGWAPAADRATGRATTPPGPPEPDEGATARINLRLPDSLKARVDEAARLEGLSVNTWLVRAAGAALERADSGAPQGSRRSYGSQRFTGWAR